MNLKFFIFVLCGLAQKCNSVTIGTRIILSHYFIQSRILIAQWWNKILFTTVEAVSLFKVHHNFLQFKNQGERNEIGAVKSNITCSCSDVPITFLRTTDIIKRIIYSSKNKILDIPPKMVSKSSVYIIENSE